MATIVVETRQGMEKQGETKAYKYIECISRDNRPYRRIAKEERGHCWSVCTIYGELHRGENIQGQRMSSRDGDVFHVDIGEGLLMEDQPDIEIVETLRWQLRHAYCRA